MAGLISGVLTSVVGDDYKSFEAVKVIWTESKLPDGGQTGHRFNVMCLGKHIKRGN